MRMGSALVLAIICIFSSFLTLTQANDYKWSRGTKQYPGQIAYGSALGGQPYLPTGNSYGKTYSGTYTNRIRGSGYGVSSYPRVGVVLPKRLGYGFMGLDMYSLLGNGLYNMMGFALPQRYGLQSISYLHPHALLHPYQNLYGYPINPFYQYGGHYNVYQMYGYNSQLGGYGNGLLGYYPMRFPVSRAFGPGVNPMFGYREPGLLDRLGFHGVSKDIGKMLRIHYNTN
jgi:hypothetical protein